MLCRLLQTLFPLLPRTNSSALRSSIRKTVLTDIRTANQKTKNHKLNKTVQAMLFSMVERGMNGEVLGDKGKVRVVGPTSDTKLYDGEEAMWAIILTKELWKKGIWSVVFQHRFWFAVDFSLGPMPRLCRLYLSDVSIPQQKCKMLLFISSSVLTKKTKANKKTRYHHDPDPEPTMLIKTRRLM